jgi:hypothetical protein
MLTSGGAYYNGDGWYWERYPNIISGMQGTTVPSTETGVTLDTPMPQSELKVGGGPSQAEIPDYGGTAAY